MVNKQDARYFILLMDSFFSSSVLLYEFHSLGFTRNKHWLIWLSLPANLMLCPVFYVSDCTLGNPHTAVSLYLSVSQTPSQKRDTLLYKMSDHQSPFHTQNGNFQEHTFALTYLEHYSLWKQNVVTQEISLTLSHWNPKVRDKIGLLSFKCINSETHIKNILPGNKILG